MLKWNKTTDGYTSTGRTTSYEARRNTSGKFVLYVGRIKGSPSPRTLKYCKAAAESLEASVYVEAKPEGSGATMFRTVWYCPWA